jgi:transcription elongation factor Elf1
MWFVILVIVIVLIVLVKKGVFRKEAQCRQCNATIKGTEQFVFRGRGDEFVLCANCYQKIHPRVSNYAKEHWSYADYQDYLEWEETTREERALFHPTDEYGYATRLRVDTDRCLFTIGSGTNDLVFRFADLKDFDINFKPEEVKEGVFSTKVKGDEYAAVELALPNVYIEEILNYGAKYKLREKGFISKKYEYELSENFTNIITAFQICVYITVNNMNAQFENQSQSIDELQKALALFMFDSMDDVTEENLKKQRNALIKAFHPDNNADNEAYSQKINAAYDLLSGFISK